MSLYLDASVLVALFVEEPSTAQAQARLVGETLLISDFAAAEFSAAIARRVRIGDMPASQAPITFQAFDSWVARATSRVVQDVSDTPNADILVRRLDLGLRAPDALHIAIARRLGATLFTFDLRMAHAARTLGLSILP